MPRVLHLLGRSADAQTVRLHAAVADRLGAEFPSETAAVGPGGDCRDALAAAAAARRSPAELVVAWGLTALAAAAMSGCRRVVFAPDRHLAGRPLRWARALLDWTAGTMVCPTDAQRQAAVRRGVRPDRCVVIRPGADFAAVRRSADARRAARAALGLAPDDFVLLAAGESTAAAGHERVVWTTGVLHILDPTYKVLIQGTGRRAAAAVHLAGKLRQSGMIVAAERRLGRPTTPEELLAAADACVAAPADVVPTLPVVSAMAAGVPVVAVATYALSELLEDRHTALMVATDRPKVLGRRVMDLRADPALAARVADTARAEAYELHRQSTMLDRYRRVFRQVSTGRAADPDAD